MTLIKSFRTASDLMTELRKTNPTLAAKVRITTYPTGEVNIKDISNPTSHKAISAANLTAFKAIASEKTVVSEV